MTLTPPTHSITIIRELPIAIERVYAAWTNHTDMELWLGKVTADVHVGGHYRFEILADDSKINVYTGTYLLVDYEKRIVQSFLAGETNFLGTETYFDEFIEVGFVGLGTSRTKVTFINGWNGDDISTDFRSIARDAWDGWLDRMEQALLKTDQL
jgi:uncharacterized protein YndB with AHSA1/START domain